jgi:hypothetical protein
MSFSITSNHLGKHTFASEEQRRYLPKHNSTLSREQPLTTAISSPITASPLTFFALVLIAAMKSVAMVILASIQITFSAAAPLTTTAIIDLKHGSANIHTTATTFVTSIIVGEGNTLAESTDTFTINSSSYIAAHQPLSAAPTYTNQTYTLADKTGTDLPNSISTKGVKHAPLATIRRPNKSSAAITAKQLVPRMIIGPNEIPMTTMEGVTSSVPYLRYTKTITLPASTPQPEPSTATTETPSISSISAISSTSSAAAATSTNTRVNESTERYRPAFAAAIVVPCVLAACWTFGIVLYWRSQQPRPVLDSDVDIEMVPVDDVDSDSALSGSTAGK